jgi:excisionase family DNA binding protein
MGVNLTLIRSKISWQAHFFRRGRPQGGDISRNPSNPIGWDFYRDSVFYSRLFVSAQPGFRRASAMDHLATVRSYRGTDEPICVTVNDACRLVGLGRTSLYELIAQRKLKTATVGRRRLILFSSLKELIGTAAV